MARVVGSASVRAADWCFKIPATRGGLFRVAS